MAILILYFAGTKISNILLCDVNNLLALLHKGIFSFPATKYHCKPETSIPVIAQFQELALQYKEHIDSLCQGKERLDKVFTSLNTKKSLHRVVLDQRINSILRQTSKELKKNITSHSFRIGQIMTLIDAGGLLQAQRLIGHKDIKTTSLYDKGTISEVTKKKIYKKLEKVKQHQIPR